MKICSYIHISYSILFDEIAHLETQPQSAQKHIQRNPAPALHPKNPYFRSISFIYHKRLAL